MPGGNDLGWLLIGLALVLLALVTFLLREVHAARQQFAAQLQQRRQQRSSMRYEPLPVAAPQPEPDGSRTLIGRVATES